MNDSDKFMNDWDDTIKKTFKITKKVNGKTTNNKIKEDKKIFDDLVSRFDKRVRKSKWKSLYEFNEIVSKILNDEIPKTLEIVRKDERAKLQDNIDELHESIDELEDIINHTDCGRCLKVKEVNTGLKSLGRNNVVNNSSCQKSDINKEKQ